MNASDIKSIYYDYLFKSLSFNYASLYRSLLSVCGTLSRETPLRHFDSGNAPKPISSIILSPPPPPHNPLYCPRTDFVISGTIIDLHVTLLTAMNHHLRTDCRLEAQASRTASRMLETCADTFATEPRTMMRQLRFARQLHVTS